MIIEHATIDDLPAILAMRAEASSWLADQGVDQWATAWPTPKAQSDRILSSIRAGETWMVRDDDGAAAATVALDTFSDPKLWTPDEQADPSMYLHRLIVRRKYAGLGVDVVEWACQRAGQLGNHWVRIDVWTDNTGLHRYYERNGFRHVRTLDLPDYPSGALFQRPATDPRSATTDRDGLAESAGQRIVTQRPDLLSAAHPSRSLWAALDRATAAAAPNRTVAVPSLG